MWLLVVNRKSGMHRALSLVNSFSELLSRNGHIYEIVDEDTANQTDIKLQELLKTGTYSKVIAFGGDGLVHLCIQHLVDTGIAFGVVAAGTGNEASSSGSALYRVESKLVSSLRVVTTDSSGNATDFTGMCFSIFR